MNLSASADYATEGTLDPDALQDDWTRVSARLGFSTPDRRWAVTLIGRNLTDQPILQSSQGFGSTHFLGYLALPRAVELQTSYRWRFPR